MVRGRAKSCECIDSTAQEKCSKTIGNARPNRLEDRCRRSLVYGQSTPQMRCLCRSSLGCSLPGETSLSNLTASPKKSQKINCRAGVQKSLTRTVSLTKIPEDSQPLYKLSRHGRVHLMLANF